MNLIPMINGTFETMDGTYVLPRQFAMDSTYNDVNKVFACRLKRLGDYSFNSQSEKIISFQKSTMMSEEAYEISVEDAGIRIKASGEKGYAYALTTLFQMMAEGSGIIPKCRITDSPRYEKRGTMLDVCRHFFSVDEVKKIIEQCSLLKMNHFHWHLSEDQGYRVESTRFPKLNKIGSWRKLAPEDPIVLKGLAKPGDKYGGFYTKDEIRDVVAYAKERQVEIIPEIDLPGHSSAILAAFPEYTCTGEPLKVKNTFGVHERIFCAGKGEVYQFLYELLDELMELFPSKYIHLGGDEAPKTVWHDCPACNAQMKKQRLGSYEQLQSFFTRKVIEHIKEKGKTPIVWNESAASGDLDPSAVIQYWIEMAPGPSYVALDVDNGRKLIISAMNQFYCSSSYAEAPLRATLMYEPEVKGIPVPDENVLGIEAPMWTEWTSTPQDIERMLYPRLLAVAECGWTKDRTVDDFMTRAERYLECPAMNILTPIPWEEATVHGEQALKMIAEGMVSMGRRYGSMSTGEEGEEAGKAEAVVPEGSQKADMPTMIRMYMQNKMQAAYSQEEIEQVIEMIMSDLASDDPDNNQQ